MINCCPGEIVTEDYVFEKEIEEVAKFFYGIFFNFPAKGETFLYKQIKSILIKSCSRLPKENWMERIWRADAGIPFFHTPCSIRISLNKVKNQLKRLFLFETHDPNCFCLSKKIKDEDEDVAGGRGNYVVVWFFC